MMKDYRLSEMKAICDKHIDNKCKGCPLFRKECAIIGQFIPSKWLVLQELEVLEELKKENETLKSENNKLKAILYAKRPECIIELENELSKQLGLEEK